MFRDELRDAAICAGLMTREQAESAEAFAEALADAVQRGDLSPDEAGEIAAVHGAADATAVLEKLQASAFFHRRQQARPMKRNCMPLPLWWSSRGRKRPLAPRCPATWSCAFWLRRMRGSLLPWDFHPDRAYGARRSRAWSRSQLAPGLRRPALHPTIRARG